MQDWSKASLVDAAAAIRSGAVRARDIAEACLDRYRRVDPTLNCFVEVDERRFLAAADTADSAIHDGAPVGPLHGVPLAHKDMYYRAGRVSACGSKLRADFVPDVTATTLARLDAAGAIEMGRLVMVEFAMGPHGYNANYPWCRNPWNTDYVPCGSSSGSGVAAAARLVHGSLGSDTGGSIRCPAAVTGIVGLLPSYGRVSRFGTMPMAFSLDSCGPMARTAGDCARLMNVIAGHDPKDASTFDIPVPDYEAVLDRPSNTLTIGIARGFFDVDVHPEVATAVANVADTFRSLGTRVIDVEMPTLVSEISELQPLVMKSEGAANHLTTMRSRQADYTFEVSQRLHAGFSIPAVDYIQALKLRGPLLSSFLQSVLSEADLLLMPVMPIRVPSIGETTGRVGKDYLDMVYSFTRNTRVANYLGLPAASVPCGFDSRGLPIAFQLLGRPFAEETILLAAHSYQSVTEWHRYEPSVS
jgi:aspartyl-tRNA(Asn)/glutamyl-tRNA(Gln) amidotransferase subunit A